MEEVPQAFADNALKNYYNSKKGSEFVADVSSDQWKDIILTSFAMGGIGDAMRSGSKSDLGKEALKVLVNNREMYDAYISGMEKTSPEMAAKIRSDIDPLLSEIDSVDGLTPKRKERSVELLFDIRTLESKLAPIVEPTLRKPIEDQIVELRKELGSIVSVPTDDYGDPLDEVAEAEKAAKEAEKTKEKVSKPSTTPTPKKPEEPPTPPAPAAASVAVEETKPAVETKATFVETPKQSVGDTQTPEVGVESTQGEKVAPTQPQSAQKANVLVDFEVTTTKGTAAPRTYTKNSNGKWIAQTKKEDGTLSKGVPVSSANIVAQLNAESSKRAADNASQDVEAKKADIEKRRQEELDNSVGEGVTKNALKKANKPSKTKEQADSEIEKVKEENKELIDKLEDPNTTEEEWDKLADELGEKFRGTSNTFWFDKKDGKIKFAYTSVGKNGRINTQYSNAEPDSVGEYEVGDLLQVSNGSTNLPAKVTKVSSTGRVLEAKTDDGTVVIRNGFVLDANQVQANRVINAKYDAELSTLEQQPAAQTTTTKTKDKETTTTSTPIQTELENIGKTPKAIQEQIYKFFTSKIPGLPEDKARELAVSTYVMWDSIGRTLGGAKGIDFIQKKLAQIGQISTAKEATKMAKDAGGSVKFQDADMVKASKESDSITLEYDKDGKHLAPNGKPSNLTEQQAKIVRTPSFKKWFGEWETDPKNASKVVDENGEPLVVYHGTNTSFTEFDNKKKGSSTKAPDTNLGFFFAESREQALRYGENVLPSFLNIRNLGATGNLVNYFAQKNSINTLEYYRDNIDTVKENLGDFISSYWNLPKDFTIDDIQERINKEVEVLNRFGPIPDISGYDGLKTPMFKSKDVNQYIAFNSNQIKLADGTNQTFNPNTSDIRFQQDSTDPSLIEQVSRDIVNNAITHIEELIGKGKEKLRAEKDTAKRKDLQKSILSLQDTQNRLKKNLKDPKFSNDQKFRAAAIDLGNNTFILAALQDPTITSPSHEFFHAAIEGVMTPEEQQAFIEEYNKEFGDKATSWNKDVSEYTARTYEKYLSNGRKLTAAEVKDTATRNKLQKAFDNFTEWAKNLYNSVIEYNNSKGVTKPINLTPQAQAFFDRVTGINTQIQTTKDESIKSESKTSSKGEEGKVGTTVAQEQGKGLGEEVSTQEEVNTESLQTKDPTQKAAQDLVTDSKKTIDELSQDQAAAILDYMKGLKIDISGLKTDCKK